MSKLKKGEDEKASRNCRGLEARQARRHHGLSGGDFGHSAAHTIRVSGGARLCRVSRQLSRCARSTRRCVPPPATGRRIGVRPSPARGHGQAKHGLSCGFASGGRLLGRSEEHTSELQSLMRISYAVFCLKKKK